MLRWSLQWVRGPSGRETYVHTQQALYKPVTLSEHLGLLPRAFSKGMHKETQGNAQLGVVGLSPAFPASPSPPTRLPAQLPALARVVDEHPQSLLAFPCPPISKGKANDGD